MCEIAWLETVAITVLTVRRIHKTLHLSLTTPRTFNSSLDLLSPAVGQWIKCALTFFSSLDSYLPVYICTVIKIEHGFLIKFQREKNPLKFSVSISHTVYFWLFALTFFCRYLDHVFVCLFKILFICNLVYFFQTMSIVYGI